MSRARIVNGRLAAGADNEQVMTQTWHQIVDTLRRLPSAGSGRTGGNDDDRKAAILEKFLIELRKGGSSAQAAAETLTPRVSPSPGDGLMTPPSGGLKRKRRPSVGVSASPAPIPAAPQSTESALSSVPSPLAGGRAGTPLASREPKQRRIDIADQLPLRPGRRIAAKSKTEEEWILAMVKKTIGGDKTRYEVQDADDGTKWVTSLRSIIPLPDREAPPSSSSHPSNLEDFPRGSSVLALYPDTTSFYQATVVSAPLPGTGMGLGVRGGNGRADPGAKAGVYRLSFVDDGDNVPEVDRDLVVLVSVLAGPH
ncbi:hypothetical protein VHUM_00388 [Vanrija humicola]|uniref:SGF29 C-terminal domain-containing protein n=1 Tax=Vanrija humicola TaxID=5417 RepID=A0A7D8ZIJ5_VANHU|nr:hypothetical protein VHUM_00388 [Vanrija humicola]